MEYAFFIFSFFHAVYFVGSTLDWLSSLGFERYGMYEGNPFMRDKNRNFAEIRNAVGTIVIGLAVIVIFHFNREWGVGFALALAFVGGYRAFEAKRNWRIKRQIRGKKQSAIT